MKIQVRELDVSADRKWLASFLERHFCAHRTPRYYEWLYLDNPAGPGRAWAAYLNGSDEVAGVAAAFPRRVHVDGSEEICWNLGDFAIREECRSLGPAVGLQRACLEEVMAGGIVFAYDHPSSSMMAIYRWLGIQPVGDVVRFAKPLRIEHRIGVLPRPVGRVGNVLLSLVDNVRTRRVTRSASTASVRFDQRADALDRALAKVRLVVGARTAAYLNWRYLDNPHSEHVAIEIGDETRLSGFAVLRREKELATLCDFGTDGDPATAVSLLSESVRIARTWEARTLDAPVLEPSPLTPILEHWGFRKRESSPFVVATQKNGPLDGIVTDAQSWYHTDGDRDV